MKVWNRLKICRLNGEHWFRKKPVLEVQSADKLWGNQVTVRVYLKVGPVELSVDVCPQELRKAIDNALNV